MVRAMLAQRQTKPSSMPALALKNKSAKGSVVVSLNIILFADPRGVWISRFAGLQSIPCGRELG